MSVTHRPSFFQESGQFQIVSDLILPDIRRRRGPGHTIRIWSAGCACGEEAYSLAMLLHRRGALSQASILATDVSHEALEIARTGIYDQEALDGDQTSMARPYMTERDGRLHLNESMKKAVRFAHLNLTLDNYPSISSGTRGMDLIFCRDVLTRFDEKTIPKVVNRIFRSLAEGGWLIIAPDDPPVFEYEAFDFVPTDHGLAYRKANLSPQTQDHVDPDAQTSAQERSELQQPPQEPSESKPAAEPRERPEPRQPSEPRRRASARRKSTTPRLGINRHIEAKQAFAEGDFQRAADLTADLRGEGAVIHIRALAEIDVAQAAEACSTATKKRPLSQELQYLYADLMIALNRKQEAIETLQRLLFLDESLAHGQFLLGTALRSQGDFDGAAAAFQRTVDLCDQVPENQPVPLSKLETAGKLLTQARRHLHEIA